MTPLPEAGEDPIEVIERLARDADPGIVSMAGPRYFGYVIGGSVPASVAADWLTSTWDQNAGLYSGGPAASVVEEAVGAWLIDLLGLPAGTSYGLRLGLPDGASSPAWPPRATRSSRPPAGTSRRRA